MSASAWSECPRCRANAEREIVRIAAVAAISYGQIPKEEWEEIRALADIPIDLDALTTLREDYEIYGGDNGTVHVSYGGECTVCHLSLSFNFARPYPGFGDAK